MACVHGGEHQLEVIYESLDGFHEVVRWCRFCGSVVVDRDSDGRTNAGAVLPMQTPSLLTEHIKTCEVYEGNPHAQVVLESSGRQLGVVYRTVVGQARELWAIERCNFPSMKKAASALAMLVRAGLLPHR